jgi:pimeloyl-ACP methyl ester carboxylesterase
LTFSECGREFLCGTLRVPLDHDDPGGVTVELAVGMLPALDPSLRIGYLLVNPGGPGGGIDGFLDFDAGLAPALLQRFDVVGWDPRGVGGSVPSGCWVEARDLYLVDPVPDSPDEEAELDAAAKALADACLANLGSSVAHIGTIDTVRDMDAIRRALGADRISYLGFSYGTLLGIHYADMFGEHLRAAVLDGVIDPSLTATELAVGQIVGFDRAVDAMFSWCRTESSCAVTGDPEAAYDGLMARLEVEPLHDIVGQVALDPARATLALVFASYSESLWPLFFQALAEAIDGYGGRLGRLGEEFIGVADLGAFSSIGCTDGGAVTALDLEALTEALIEVAGDLGAASVVSVLPCEHWPVATATLPVGAVSAPDAPPILVVGSRGDNAAPYEWAAAVADQLHSGVLLSYDGNNHTSYGLSDCVARVVHEYLIDLVVPPGPVDCPAGPR